MARRDDKMRKLGGLSKGLDPQAKAILKAFRQARYSAPGFVLSCGMLPELSEAASDRLHAIVNEVAVEHLRKADYESAVAHAIQKLVAASSNPHAGSEIAEKISNDLTALLVAEATAAYLFGLSVGLSVRSLPERLAP